MFNEQQSFTILRFYGIDNSKGINFRVEIFGKRHSSLSSGTISYIKTCFSNFRKKFIILIKNLSSLSGFFKYQNVSLDHWAAVFIVM